MYGQPQYFQPTPPGEQMSPWDYLHLTPRPTYHHGHSLQVLIREPDTSMQHHIGGESGSHGHDQHASQDFSQPKGQRLRQSDKRQQQTSEAGVRYVNKMKGKAKQRNTSKTQFIKYERVRNKIMKNHNYTLLDSFAEEEWNKYKKRKSQNTRRRKIINEFRSQKGLPMLPLPSELQDSTLEFETWKAVNGFTYDAEGRLQHPHLQLPPTDPQEYPLFPTEPMREEHPEEEEEEGVEEEEDESDAGFQGPSSEADSLYYTDMQVPIEYNFFGPHSRR